MTEVKGLVAMNEISEQMKSAARFTMEVSPLASRSWVSELQKAAVDVNGGLKHQVEVLAKQIWKSHEMGRAVTAQEAAKWAAKIDQLLAAKVAA